MRKICLLCIISIFGLASLSQAKVTRTAPKKDDSCNLHIEQPDITYYFPNGVTAKNNANNSVNSGVLNKLTNNGFKITQVSLDAEYIMATEVRCGPVLTWFGPQDMCQTQVRIYNSVSEKVFDSNPTTQTPGLNINFDSISFPTCDELKK